MMLEGCDIAAVVVCRIYFDSCSRDILFISHPYRYSMNHLEETHLGNSDLDQNYEREKGVTKMTTSKTPLFGLMLRDNAIKF